jgi:hypothetical protein
MADNIPDDLALFLKSANLEGFKAHFNRTGTRCVEHLQDVDIDDLKETGTATNFVINSILNLKCSVCVLNHEIVPFSSTIL